MQSIKSYMSSDHKSCDETFADTENAIAVGNWDGAKTSFKKLHSDFLRHFNMEESVLFPAFEDASGMSCGPTEVMRMEHEQMRQTLSKLESEIENKNKDSSLGICDSFNILVQQHNFKEEGILYTMADNVLAANAQEIITKMSSVA